MPSSLRGAEGDEAIQNHHAGPGSRRCARDDGSDRTPPSPTQGGRSS